MTPLTYSFGLIAYVIVINLVFISEFRVGTAYIMAFAGTVLSYGVAFHYQIFKTYLDGKNPNLRYYT